MYCLNKLPVNTTIYHRIGLENREFVCNVETAGECKFYFTQFLCFRLQDGLWATGAAIDYWQRYPHCHPHYTLFEALYTRLMKNLK